MFRLTLVSHDGQTQTDGGKFPNYEAAHKAGMLYGSVFFIDNNHVIYEEEFKAAEFKTELRRIIGEEFLVLEDFRAETESDMLDIVATIEGIVKVAENINADIQMIQQDIEALYLRLDRI